jgi:hypothetical protein
LPPVVVDELGGLRLLGEELTPFLAAVESTNASDNIGVGYVDWAS